MQYNSIEDTQFSSSRLIIEYRDVVELPQTSYNVDNSETFQSNASAYSTATEDMMQNDGEILSSWQKEIPAFINLLHHTSFEDGVSNEAIEWVQSYYNTNVSVTLLWLYSVRAQSQDDDVVLDSLLRLLAYMEVPQVYAMSMVPLVELALTKENCQESAIMLCEIWRSRECLSALNSAHIAQLGVRNYAEKVIAELKNELSV